MALYQGLIHRYKNYLPITESAIVTLNEGRTPLLKATRLAKHLGISAEIYLKYEGLNPTGSFKDRGMTYALSKAKEEGAKAVICASTGNTSASASAYAAKAGMKSVVLIPHGSIAFGKLSQAMMHGALVVQIKGNFDEALKMVLEVGKKYPIQIVNSVNPYRLEGQQTAAFEICEDLEKSPDYQFIPVGNAGNISAYWMGYLRFLKEGKITKTPKMMGFQASGASPIVNGKPVKNPKTIATAIKIGNPASWATALKARDESGGVIDKISDREILKAYKLLGEIEGVFCEPASAISVAGLIKAHEQKLLKNNPVCVCTLTGHGLKDPDNAIKNSEKPLLCNPSLSSLEKLFLKKAII